MISRLDRQVGEVMALLKELEVDDHTLVIFTSDNGAQGATWRPLIEFFDGTGGLRGEKGNFYEGGIRVPLIARWPGKIAPGTTSALIVAFWDLLPTLADAAQVRWPRNLDGISFLPMLTGVGFQRTHPFLYWEYPRGDGVEQAVRMRQWKAVIPKPGAPLELYNLRRDPKETTDRAKDQPEIVKKIEGHLKTARTAARDYPAETQRPNADTYVY